MRAIALLLLLAGCSTDNCPPQVATVAAKPYPVPVPVRCIDAATIAAEPAPTKLTGDARNDADLLGAKVSDLRVWGRSLVAMMGPCEM